MMVFAAAKQPGALDRLIVHALESIAEAVSVTDLNDRFTFVNQAFLAIYGYTREEILGRHVNLIWSPNNPPGLHREILDLTRTGGWKGEVLNRTKDGREIPIALSTSHIRDEAGQILGLVGIAQDITDRQEAKGALISRTQQLEAIRVITTDIIQELDLSALLDLITRHASELIAAGMSTIWLWDEAAQVLIPATWRGYGSWRGEMRLRLGEGLAGTVAERREGLLVNEYRTSPYAHPMALERTEITAALAEPLLYRKRLVGVIVVSREETGLPFTPQDREILALFAAQAAIAIENARLYAATERAGHEARSLYEVAHSLTTSLDPGEVLHLIAEKTTQLLDTPHAQVVLWDENSGSLRLGAAYGTETDKVRGQQFRMGQGVNGIVAQARAPLVVNDYQAFPHRVKGLTEVVADIGVPLLYQGRFLGVLNSHATKPGWVFTEEHLALLTSFADHAAMAIENARLHEAVRQQAADLETRVRQRTAEMEEALRVKALFLANMSHELRTPLNFVIGFSEILREGTAGALSPKQATYVERIRSGGKRLLELVTDLLEMAEADTGPTSFQLDRLVVEEILEEVLAPLVVIAQAKSVALEVNLHPGMPVVVADRRKFSQILHHLVTNAIRFTPTGGRVTVRTRRISGPKGEEATFTVQDTGIGIRPEDRERIFRPFEQVDGSDTRQYGGAGIGLALVRRLVELHGGCVWAESEGEGRGARFIVRLPLLPAPPAPRILVVDDEETVREAISAALAAAGYTVDGACTGLEALERLAAGPPDLLVLDIGLPDLDGRDLLKRVRADAGSRDVPILVLTGLNSLQPDQILALGADEFLTKPLSLQILSTTVTRLLRRPVRENPGGAPGVGVAGQEITGDSS